MGWFRRDVRDRGAAKAGARSVRRPFRHRSIERLEARQALAIDLATITGTVFEDLTGNGLTADDPRLAAVTVTLLRDGGNGTFDNGGGDDTLVGTSPTNASGVYRFDNLAAGRYWVQQSPIPGLAGPTQPASILITAQQAAGIPIQTIDSFSQTEQNLEADGATPTATSIAAASEAIGGERDIAIALTTGTLPLTLSIDQANSNLLAFGAELGVTGTALIQYDGADGSTTLNATGLNGVDLTDGQSGAGIRLTAFGDQSGASATVRIYSNAGNSSSAQFVIPNQGSAEELFIPFSAFTALSGGGADFSNVGAIEVFMQGVPSLDAQVTILSSQAPTIQTANFANTTALTLGDRVWVDLNNNGLLEAGENGIGNVTVNLYHDVDNNGLLNTATDSLIATTETNSTGNYLFTNLLGGDYIIQIPNTELVSGGTLFGYSSSTGAGAPADPDNNVDNDNNGSFIQGLGIVSGAIGLLAGAEPTNDGDEDPDTNLTLDLGVVPQGDVAINKTRTTTDVTAGNNVVYSLIVTNNGPLPATNVVVTDPLPTGTSFVAATSSQGSVSSTNGQITANLGTLASGGSATINLTLAVNPTASGTLTNTASVTANELDTVPANNTDSDSTPILRRADLRIVKSESGDPIAAGSPLVYTLIVTNDGPSTATGVVVTDALPSGLSFVSANSSLGSVSNSGGNVTANIGTLAVGQTATVTINTQTDLTLNATLTNTANVTSQEQDLDPADNSSTITTVVQQQLDLRINKQILTPGGAIVGGQLVYQIEVTNAGPSAATGVVVTDQLPAGLTFVSGSVPGGTVTASGSTITANIDNLANGGSTKITITTNIATNASGTLTNNALVTSNQVDTNTSNNRAAATAVVDTRNALIAGRVFVDLDEDQLYDFGESTLGGVTIILSGTESGGLTVNRTTVTASDGTYQFTNLAGGTYSVRQIQPDGVRDGDALLGEGATAVAADNLFTQLALGRAAQALDFNFSELRQFVSKRRLLASAQADSR